MPIAKLLNSGMATLAVRRTGREAPRSVADFPDRSLPPTVTSTQRSSRSRRKRHMSVACDRHPGVDGAPKLFPHRYSARGRFRVTMEEGDARGCLRRFLFASIRQMVTTSTPQRLVYELLLDRHDILLARGMARAHEYLDPSAAVPLYRFFPISLTPMLSRRRNRLRRVAPSAYRT